MRSNAWHRNGAYNTALDLTMNTCDNSSQMPLVNLFQRDDVFFATDINHIQHLNQRLVSLYAQVETITVEGKVVSILILKYFFLIFEKHEKTNEQIVSELMLFQHK